MKGLKHYNNGLTLIELILVIAIILTISTFSGVFYSRFLTQNAVANTVDQLTGSLRKAQVYSMTGKGGGNWGVKYAPGTITLFKVGSAAFDETFSVNSNISVSGFTQITFSQVTGLPDSAPTITISGNNNSKTVSVNSQGVVNR